MTVVCPKCSKIAWNPIVQTITNKSGIFTYKVFRHPKRRQKTGRPYVQRHYVRIAGEIQIGIITKEDVS